MEKDSALRFLYDTMECPQWDFKTSEIYGCMNGGDAELSRRPAEGCVIDHDKVKAGTHQLSLLPFSAGAGADQPNQLARLAGVGRETPDGPPTS